MARKQCHFKVFRSDDFLFMCSLYSVEFVTVSGNLLCQLADHLLQFLVLKDFRVSHRPKHEQIFKLNYTFFNNNELKNEIDQIDWKTLFDGHDINLCLRNICISLLAFLMIMHQFRNYRKRRNLSLVNHELIITYDN